MHFQINVQWVGGGAQPQLGMQKKMQPLSTCKPQCHRYSNVHHETLKNEFLNCTFKIACAPIAAFTGEKLEYAKEVHCEFYEGS